MPSPNPRQYRRIRREILERDGCRCVKCGKAGRLEVDHIEPREHGGSDDPENLRALCVDCHFKRHNPPTVAAWRELVRELQ